MPEVTDPRLLVRLNQGTQVKPADPKLPGELTGQSLNNANAAVNAQVNQATQGAQIREARAKADKAETEARAARVGNINPAAKVEDDLRSRFEGLGEVRAYKDAVSALGGMLRAPDTSGGDINVIYAFIRAQGPGPVAEGELQLAQGAASLREDLERKYGKLTDSNRLPRRVRLELIESARQSVAGKGQVYSQTYQQYRDLAAQNGANPERVTGPYAGEAILNDEARYIRQHGGNPTSAITGQPIGTAREIAAPGSKFVTQLNSERSALIDNMVRSGVPFEQAQAQYRQRFPDAPVFDSRAKWNEALGFARKHPGAAGSFGQSLDTVPLNQTDQDRNFVGQTSPGRAATLYFNAAAGGVPSALAGDDGLATVQGAREGLGFGGSLAAEGLGAVTGTLGLGAGLRAGGRLLGGGAGRFLANNPVGSNMAADIGYGSIFGATQSPDNPLAGAALGAGAGLVGNQIGSRVFGPGIRAAEAPTRRLLGLPEVPQALSRGQNALTTPFLDGGGDAAIARMNDAAGEGMPFAWADADPRLRALGGSAVRFSPDALALADQNLGTRTLGQVDRLTNIVEGEVGPRLNIPTFKEGARAAAQRQSRPLYESAKAQPPVDDAQINDMLRTPAGQKAARSGYDEALNNGEPVGDLVPEVDSITGEVRLVGRPSWNVLQRMKFALDEMPDQASLARRFNSRLGTLNKDFRKANEVYAREIGRGDIAESGYNAFSPNVKTPQLSAELGRTGDQNLFRQGYGSNIVDKARSQRDVANPYELASIASPDQMSKMEAISPNLANRFGTARGLERDMALTNRELFGGSPTQPRAMADESFGGGIFPSMALDIASSAASGAPLPLATGRTLFQRFRDSQAFGLGNATSRRTADELAPLLFNADPADNLLRLNESIAARQARDLYSRSRGLLGSSVGAPLAIGYSVNR